MLLCCLLVFKPPWLLFLTFYILTRSLISSPESALFQVIPLYIGGVRDTSSILSYIYIYHFWSCVNLVFEVLCVRSNRTPSVLLDYGLRYSLWPSRQVR